MNNLITDHYLLQFRLRTARHKRRLQHKDFEKRLRIKKKKRKFGKKIYVVRPQELLMPDKAYIVKHKFSEKELALFEEKEIMDTWRNKPVIKYVFTQPWQFVLRVRPNIITKVQIKDVELEQRIGHIENYIERNHLRGKMYRLLYGHYKYKCRYVDEEKVKERSPLKNKSLQQILDICRLEND